MVRGRRLSQAHIKQCQPILKRLQGKTAEDKPYPECSQPSLWKIVGVSIRFKD